MEHVNERSTAYLSVTFRDKDSVEQAPSAVTYRVDDVDSGAEIRESTSIAAAGTVQITLTPSDNVIVGENHEKELRRVTVEATYGADDAVREQFLYAVKNLRAVV
jgi:hypothetical protein